MSPGVELLTMDVKSCRGIRISPMDTCPSPFHPRVKTVPVCSVGDPWEAEMKSYGLAALAPLAITHPSPASGGTSDPCVPSRGTKAIATANLHIELPEFDPKNLPEWVEEFLEFLLLTGQQHAAVKTTCTLIKKACKKNFLRRQVKTAIKKSSNWGGFFKRLQQMYPVYETDLSVRTEIAALPTLPEFPTATGRSGRRKEATRRNMRREERVTVQGPVKKQQPNGMSHRGSSSDGCQAFQYIPAKGGRTIHTLTASV